MALLLGIAGASDFVLLRNLLRRLRGRCRRVGATAFVALGFVAELGWAFIGSLGFGLGMRPAVAGEDVARLLLVVAVALAAVVGLAGWLAAPDRERLH